MKSREQPTWTVLWIRVQTRKDVTPTDDALQYYGKYLIKLDFVYHNWISASTLQL